MRYYLKNGLDRIPEIDGWDLSKTRNFFTCFVNYQRCEEAEGEKPTRVPRVLNAPATAMGRGGDTVLARRAEGLTIGAEVCFVVSRLACRVDREKAEDYILGYAPMISVTDESFADQVIEPASPQERGLPKVYGRWGDGYNAVGELRPAMDWNAEMELTVNGETVKGSAAEYRQKAAEALWFISQEVTLFPGDVVTLGRVAERIRVDAAQDDIEVSAYVAGLGCVRAKYRRNGEKQ